MGIFGQFGTFAESRDWAVAQPGTYKCELLSVDVVERPAFNNPGVMENNFKWVFRTTEVGDDEGRPFDFVHFTKTSYGNDAAKLTKLLDGMLCRRLTKAEYANLSMEELAQTEWMVTVETYINSRGGESNAIKSVVPKPVKPPKGARLINPPRKDDDIKDPFAD